MSLLLTLGLGVDASASGGNTPYMNLLLPTVSVTLGPLYATEVNQAFDVVDAHNHAPGFGALVPTSGLDINANLPFNGNQLLNLDAATFNIRSPNIPASIGTVYFSGQDLYVIDGQGNVIQITAAGAVNSSGSGGWTGLTSPAQASYSSVTKTFSLQSNTTGPKYGNLATGKLRIFPSDPATGLPYIEIATPGAGVTSYTMQLPPTVPAGAGNKQLLLLNNDGTVTLGPTLPLSTSFLRIGSTGTPAADVVLDNVTVNLFGSSPFQLQVKPLGIDSTRLAAGAVTADKLSSALTQVSGPFNGSVPHASSTTVTVGSVNYTILPASSGKVSFEAVNAALGGQLVLGNNDASVTKFQVYDGVTLVADNTSKFGYGVFAAGVHTFTLKYTQTGDGSFDAAWANVYLKVTAL